MSRGLLLQHGDVPSYIMADGLLFFACQAKSITFCQQGFRIIVIGSDGSLEKNTSGIGQFASTVVQIHFQLFG